MSTPPARWAWATTTIMFRHLLPNAMVATLTFLPFILSGSITTLTSLDFLGFGLPPGSPRWAS
jgi:microcin C transport system permease protein